MTVYELTKEQLHELKVDFLLRTRESVAWKDLADADRLVPDRVIQDEYAGAHFVPEDFMATATSEYAIA